MLKNRIVALILVLVSALFLTGTAAAQESVYKFTLAWGGPWDLSQGRIDIRDQPDDPYWRYVAEQVGGAAPLTYSWEWNGSTGYIQGLRLMLLLVMSLTPIRPWSSGNEQGTDR